MGVIDDAISVSPLALAGEFQDIFLAIQELTGQKRIVQLTRASMPFAPINYEQQQQITETKYPGTPKKTIHVLGPELMPTTFNGHWSAQMLKDWPIIVYKNAIEGMGEEIASPSAARALFNDIFRSGQKLLVYYVAPAETQFQALPKSVSRNGIMTGLKLSEHKWSSIDWEMTFTWDEAEISVTPVPILPPSIPVGNLLSMINNAIKQVTGLVDGVLSDIQGLVDGVTGYLKMVQTAAEELTEIAEGFASLPAETAGQVLDGLNGIKGTFDGMMMSMNSVVTAYTNVGDQWNALVSDKTATDIFYGDKDEADGADQVAKAQAAAQVKETLDSIQYEIERQIRICKEIVENATVKDIYVTASQGDSFVKWAIKYGFKYWLTIALANNVFEDRVVVGQQYRIPMSQREQ